jgi:hypothetical protein
MSKQEDVMSSGSSTDGIETVQIFTQGPHFVRVDPGSELNRGKVQLNAKVNKYEDEGEHETDRWLSHACQVIVLTYSGKPVYTRYGREDLIAGFAGTLQALMSKFSLTGFGSSTDRLRSMSLGNFHIEFLDKSPLVLVCISRHIFTPRSTLRRLLKSVHSALLFVLTSGVNTTLISRPNFDVRTLLGGTKPLLGNLISWMNRDMLLSIDESAIEPLPLPLATRSSVMKILQEDCPSSCFLGILLVGHRVVATCSGADAQPLLSASDLVMLISLVISSTSLRSSESWTPLCLPTLSHEAFVYAYVQFLTADVSFVCISLSPDNNNFYAISNHAEVVRLKLGQGDTETYLQVISTWALKCPLVLQALGSVEGSLDKREAISRVRHCAIVLNHSRQLFSSKITRTSVNHDYKDVFRLYQQGISLLKDYKRDTSQQVSITHKNDFIFVWTTSEFQFFLTAPRGVDVSVITYVYQWMRENEQILFIPNLGFSGGSGTRIHSRAPSLW